MSPHSIKSFTCAVGVLTFIGGIYTPISAAPKRQALPKASTASTPARSTSPEQNLSFLFVLEKETQWSLIIQDKSDMAFAGATTEFNASPMGLGAGGGLNSSGFPTNAASNSSNATPSGAASPATRPILEKNGKPESSGVSILILEGNTEDEDPTNPPKKPVKPTKPVKPIIPNPSAPDS